MKGYYVVVDEGPPYKSEDFDLPPNMAQDDAIVFIHGLMFRDSWCQGTNHAIYIDLDGSGYEVVYEDDFPFEDSELITLLSDTLEG